MAEDNKTHTSYHHIHFTEGSVKLIEHSLKSHRWVFLCMVLNSHPHPPPLPLSLIQVAEDLLKSKDLTNVPAVRHGKQKEAVAVREFERISGHRTKPYGLFVHRTCPFLAASPDRLVDICGVPYVVEVKCPFAAKDYEVDANKIPYLFVGEQGDMQLKDSHEYYYQVQGQVACTGFVSCVFIVHTNVETKFFFFHLSE